MNETNKCFLHSGDDPVTKIKIQQCKDPLQFCMIDADTFAWVNNDLQFTPVDQRRDDPFKSQVHDKITEKMC